MISVFIAVAADSGWRAGRLTNGASTLRRTRFLIVKDAVKRSFTQPWQSYPDVEWGVHITWGSVSLCDIINIRNRKRQMSDDNNFVYNTSSMRHSVKCQNESSNTSIGQLQSTILNRVSVFLLSLVASEKTDWASCGTYVPLKCFCLHLVEIFSASLMFVWSFCFFFSVEHVCEPMLGGLEINLLKATEDREIYSLYVVWWILFLLFLNCSSWLLLNWICKELISSL